MMTADEYNRKTEGFHYQQSSQTDCLFVCMYNLFRYVYIRIPEPVLKISQDDFKKAGYWQGDGFYKHSALFQNINLKIESSSYSLKEAAKGDGMNLSRMIDIITNDNCSPLLIRVRAEYFREQYNQWISDTPEPIDHCIMIIDIDEEAQVAVIFDPLEIKLNRKQNTKFKREIPLAPLIQHWSRSRYDPNWSSWLQRKTGQMKLRVE